MRVLCFAALFAACSCSGASSQGGATNDCVREINGDSCSCNAVNPRYQGGTDHCGPSDVSGSPVACCTIVASAMYCACNAYVCSTSGPDNCGCVWYGAPLYQTVVPSCASAPGTYCCAGSLAAASGIASEAGADEPFGTGCVCSNKPCGPGAKQVPDCGGNNTPPACPAADAVSTCQ